MVGKMLMVLIIMISESLILLVGGVADADERLVESKQLEWLRSGAASGMGVDMGCSWSTATVVGPRKKVGDSAA
jgi:hypothetical protein